jgi:hypothetical protein
VKLPAFDQVLELRHGEAQQFLAHFAAYGQRVATVLGPGGHGSLEPVQLLALPTLNRLAKRVGTLAGRERRHVGEPPRRPRRLRLSYDELIAVRLCLPVTGDDAVLGQVQQKGLSLAPYVRI